MNGQPKNQGTVILVVLAAVIVAVLVGGAALSQSEIPAGVGAGLVWLALYVAASFIPILVLYYVIRAAVLAALREHERDRTWTVPAAGPQPASKTTSPPWPKHGLT